jgi:hypothetical protein
MEQCPYFGKQTKSEPAVSTSYFWTLPNQAERSRTTHAPRAGPGPHA